MSKFCKFGLSEEIKMFINRLLTIRIASRISITGLLFMLVWMVDLASGQMPALSPPFLLGGDAEIGTALQDQEHVVIKAGGAGFLAVWTDKRAVLNGLINAPESELSGNMLDIYGQLLDADGKPVGSPIIVTNAGRSQRRPDLAWNETAQAWLVAFEGDDPDWYFDNNVYGVRVSSNGTILDGQQVLLFSEADGQGAYLPAVASDGTSWVVTAEQWFGTPTLQRTIRGRRMATNGILIDAAPVVISQNSALLTQDVAYANGVYLLVQQHNSQNQVWGTRFDNSLNLLGKQFQIGQGISTSDSGSPRVASNGQRFMVVGRNAHRIETDGTNLDPTGIDLGGPLLAGYLDVGWTGVEWVTSMLLSNGTTLSIYFQRIGDDGTQIDINPIEVEDVTFGFTLDRTTVAGRDGSAQIGYPHRSTPGSNAKAIRGAHLESDGLITGLQTVSIGLPRQSFSELVRGPGNEMLAVYVRDVDGETSIMSRRLTTDGIAIDVEPTVVDSGAFITALPKAAWNGSVYLIVWSPTDSEVTVGKRVAADNTVIDTNVIPIANAPPPGESYTCGAVGAAGETFVVGILRRINFGEPVRYAEYVRVDGATGNVLDSNPVFVTAGFAREMTGDSFDDKAILAWAQYGIHDSPSAFTEAILVDAAGIVTGPIRVSVQRGKEPDIAIGIDRALIVWHDDTTIHQDNVEGRFMFSDGSLAASEFTISGAPQEQMFPAAGWDGDQFVVAWNDYRHIVSIQQARSDIWAARVLSDGTVIDPSGFQITDSALPEDLPAVAGGDGQAIIMYSRLDGLDGVPEIQRLVYHIVGEPACVSGDLNGDNVVNLLDVAPFVEAITTGQFTCEGDMNGDSAVNLLDVAPFVDLLSAG